MTCLIYIRGRKFGYPLFCQEVLCELSKSAAYKLCMDLI